MLRYCCHANCRRFKHPSDFDESEEPRATCRKHKKEPPEAKKVSLGHGARVHGATARDAGGEGEHGVDTNLTHTCPPSDKHAEVGGLP